MDNALEFIAAIVAMLAWPITVLWLAWYLKRLWEQRNG